MRCRDRAAGSVRPPLGYLLAAQQLDGADPASCGESSLSYYLSAGRAAHLEAVRRPRQIAEGHNHGDLETIHSLAAPPRPVPPPHLLLPRARPNRPLRLPL